MTVQVRSKLEVRPARAIGDDVAWDEYVRPFRVGITYTSTYRRFLRELLGCADDSLLALRDGQIAGVLPLMRCDGPLGPVWNSLPLSGSDGGIVSDDEDASRELVTFYRLLTARGLSSSVVASPLVDVQPWPETLRLTTVGQFTTLRDEPEPELFDRLEQRGQTAVRKARACGVDAGLDASPDTLAWLQRTHEQTYRAIGVEPKSARFFELVAELLRPGIDYDIAVAHLNGERVAGALLFAFGDVVEYWLTALTPAGRASQAMSLAVYTGLRDLGRSGRKLWVWGSYVPGVQDNVARFKRQWAAYELEYAYIVRVTDPTLEQRTPDELAAGYPGFFVYPFDRLRPA